MGWPIISKTTFSESSWEVPKDAIPAMTGLYRETSDWVRTFANQLFPEEGLDLEDALHWACFSRMARGLRRISRDLSLPDSEGLLINCRLVCEDALNCHLMGQTGGARTFLVEGHQLEGQLRKDLQSKKKNGSINPEEEMILQALDQLWAERRLPEKLPGSLTELKRLQAVENGADGAHLPMKRASQAIHGTSRWLEDFDLIQINVLPGVSEAVVRYHLRQEDPPLDLVLAIYTLNRGIAALRVLANSITNLPDEIMRKVIDLEARALRITEALKQQYSTEE